MFNVTLYQIRKGHLETISLDLFKSKYCYSFDVVVRKK